MTRSPAAAEAVQAQALAERPVGLVDGFCHAKYTGSFNRERCAEEQMAATLYLFAYGTEVGLFRDGDVVPGYIVSDAFSLRGLAGFPSQDPLLRCFDEVSSIDDSFFGPTDSTAVWACVKRLDPSAARFEQP